MAKGNVRIGLSGWSYGEWKDSFYAGVKRKDWLAHAARCFPTLEANGTFYRGQKASTFERWREETPEDFRFTVKGHRVVTHRRRLQDAKESIIRQRDNARPLGEKLACVLWQLPGNFKADGARLREFLKALRAWRGPVHVMEFRHPSWFTEEIADALADAGVANCVSHAGNWPMWEQPAGPLVYVRLHGAPRTYYSTYGPQKLKTWAKRIERWRRQGRDVSVYFDNDAEGAAPRNAARLIGMVPGARH